MVNQLGKFSPNLATLIQPLRELLNTWIWGPSQEQAFAQVKQELSQPTVLTLYDPERVSKISADASMYGLGAVLLQEANYDSSHGTRPLAEIPDDTTVWVTTENQHSPGRVAAHVDAPRSYLVQTPAGHNRAHRTESPDRKDPTAGAIYPKPYSFPYQLLYCPSRQTLNTIPGKGDVA